MSTHTYRIIPATNGQEDSSRRFGEEMMVISKVLVVDDSKADRVNLQNIVSDAGLMVLTASTGDEGIRKAKAEKPDLIFLDIIMDEMDGFQTCRTLSRDEETRGIPIVMVSCKNQKADKVWAEAQGATAYITKPYTPDQILDQISRLQ